MLSLTPSTPVKIPVDKHLPHLWNEQGNHVKSDFIQSLVAKYPKACNRSLTNLSVVGLATPNRPRTPKLSLVSQSRAAKSKDTLTNFAKGLSSSQPDLLSTGPFEFSSNGANTLIGVASTHDDNISGIQVQRNIDSSTTHLQLPGNLASSGVYERIKESKLRLNELTSKICELSRSQQNLLDISTNSASDKKSHETGRVALSSNTYNHKDNHDVDDSAPESTQQTKKPSKPVTPSASTSNKEWSIVEAKTKLEELRDRLFEKCRSLQQRRDEINKQIQVSSKDDKTSGHNSSSSKPIEDRYKAKCSSRSGTDSDGDSGICIAAKLDESSTVNPLVPKLKKFPKAPLLLNIPDENRMEELKPKVIETSDRPADCSKTIDMTAEMDSEEVEIPDIDRVTESGRSMKSVRFSLATEEIGDDTPRLKELRELAEKSIQYDDTAFPDTPLDEIGTDSDCSEESSSPDMTDIDPRIARLAFDLKEYTNQNHLKPKSLFNSKTANSVSNAIKIDGLYKALSHNSTTTQKDGMDKPDKSVGSNKEVNQNGSKWPPPKPPRLSHDGNNASNSDLETHKTNLGQQPTHKSETTSSTNVDVEKVGNLYVDDNAYSIVDSSAFKTVPHFHKTVPLNSMKMQTVGTDKKPPIPQTSPTKDSNGGKVASTARRQKLSKLKTKVDSDQNSTVSDDDNLSTISHCSGRSARSSSSNSTNVHSKKQPTLREKSASQDDLWSSNVSIGAQRDSYGSNASLNSSQSSVFERVGSLKKAAKKKMQSLRRSLSLDKLSGSSKVDDRKSSPKQGEGLGDGQHNGAESLKHTPPVPSIKKSLSWKNLNKLKLTKKSSSSKDVVEKVTKSPPVVSDSPPAYHVENPNHFRAIGKILNVHPDGSRLVQLVRPPHGTYGFYVGHTSSGSGVVITRLSDSYPEKMFSGLLAVGDEIKGLNGKTVKKMHLDEVHDIISKSKTLNMLIKSDAMLTREEWF